MNAVTNNFNHSKWKSGDTNVLSISGMDTMTTGTFNLSCWRLQQPLAICLERGTIQTGKMAQRLYVVLF
jgi:hypothetical protein